MEFLKLKTLINEKFVSRITILLLGVWIIIISQNKNLPNKNNKNIKTPKITKEIIIEEKNIKPKKPKAGRGWLWIYSNHVKQANEGCDFDFLETNFGKSAKEPDIF